MTRRAGVALGLAVAVGLVGLLLAAGLGSLGGERSGGGGWLEIPAAEVPFRTLEGGTASLADFRGQVVLLNFWGTWCPPCRREIPELVQLQTALSREGGTVIGVAVESGSPGEIRSFAEKFGVNYPIWISDAQTALAHYDAMGYPFTLLIDGSGTIRRQYLGPQSVELLATDVEALTGRALPLPAEG